MSESDDAILRRYFCRKPRDARNERVVTSRDGRVLWYLSIPLREALPSIGAGVLDLCDADFSDADCFDMDFSSCRLRRADFRRADCGDTMFMFADLAAADFREAEVSRCTFDGARLCGALFSGAIMVPYHEYALGAEIPEWELMSFRGADLRGLDLDQLDSWWAVYDRHTLFDGGVAPEEHGFFRESWEHHP
jgi:hypothetical protein